MRADRQPEFTQIDMELSFVDIDDVIDVNERLLAKLFKDIMNIEVPLPIPRMTWQEAMDRFGSDKPDIRFGMELTDVTEVVKDCEFVVFKGAIENGGSVRGINVKGQGAMPRKKIDKLVEFAKGYGAKGLAYIAVQEDGSVKSSFAKFMKEDEMTALIKAMDGENGDLLLFAADKTKLVWDVLGALRLELAKQLELFDKMNLNSFGLRSSRSLNGARKKDDTRQCIIHLRCRWKRIWNIWKQTLEECVRKLMISFLTEMKSAAEAFVFFRMIFRVRCLNALDLHRNRHRKNSVFCLRHSNMGCLRMPDLRMDLTVSLC